MRKRPKSASSWRISTSVSNPTNSHILEIDKSGIVKEEAFFTILTLHGIILSQEEQNKLKKNHARAGKIDFKDALHAVNIDLDSAVLKEEKWQVANQDGKAQNAEVS